MTDQEKAQAALYDAGLDSFDLALKMIAPIAAGTHVIVPLHSTDKMLEAGKKAWRKPRLHVRYLPADDFMTCAVIYEAMLAAAGDT
jgi:hypothetical protein